VAHDKVAVSTFLILQVFGQQQLRITSNVRRIGALKYLVSLLRYFMSKKKIYRFNESGLHSLSLFLSCFVSEFASAIKGVILLTLFKVIFSFVEYFVNFIS
jgi:hypothetical protein